MPPVPPEPASAAARAHWPPLPPDPVLAQLPARQVCRCVPRGAAVRAPDPACPVCRGSGRHDAARANIVRDNAARRIPTAADYAGFDGAHCARLYAKVGPDWSCPACRRSRFELLRWTMLYPHRPDKHMGWAAGLHEHHDHGADRLHNGGVVRAPRFAPTVLCEQCNSADATAKRQLGLPRDFSFSPAEIGAFVRATPHGWHLLELALAQRLSAQALALRFW